MSIAPDDPRHGTTRGYHAGCHESCCRGAMARYEKAGRLARLRGGRAVPALGSKRRLQALMRLGWSSQRIAAEAGLPHRNHVWRLLHGQKGKPTVWVQRSTQQWVNEVYDRLSMQIPTGPYVERTRKYAEAQGWAPPLAWDEGTIDDPTARPKIGNRQKRRNEVDEAVVTRFVAGEYALRTNIAERREIARAWVAAGRSLNELMRLTGWKADRYIKLGEAAA